MPDDPHDDGRDAGARAGATLSALAACEPGPELIAGLLALDPGALRPHDAVAYLVQHQRIAAWWASIEHKALVSAASGHPVVEELLVLDPRPAHEEERRIRISDAAREEVAAALRLAPATAQDRIDTARLLAGALQGTADLLARGRVSARHAEAIARAARRLPGATVVLDQPPHHDTRADAEDRVAFHRSCTLLEGRVLRIAQRDTVSATRRAAERAVVAIDPDGAARRRQQARSQRDVVVIDEADGVSLLLARLGTEQAHACLAAVNAASRLLTSARGTVPTGASRDDAMPRAGERRADALVALVLGGGDVAGGPDLAGAADHRRQGARLRAHLDVAIDLTTLLALRGSEGVATIVGSGAVPAAVVRDLFVDPDVDLTIRRLVTDPLTGHLLDVGRRTYAVPAALRDFVRARDGTCRFPGCARAARRCQLDHAVPFGDGGATSAANLGALCARHHQLKTHGNWDLVRSSADGSCVWISPQGRRYEQPAREAVA